MKKYFFILFFFIISLFLNMPSIYAQTAAEYVHQGNVNGILGNRVKDGILVDGAGDRAKLPPAKC